MTGNILVLLVISVFGSVLSADTDEPIKIGNGCTITGTSTRGTCVPDDECQNRLITVRQDLNNERCGWKDEKEIVCCTDPQHIDTERKCKIYSEFVYENETVPTLTGESNRKVDKCRSSVHQLIETDMASPREFPHMVLIGFGKPHDWECSGSLISEDYVITAAHCLHHREFGAPKYVLLGDLDTETDKDDARPEIIEIEEVIPHPDFKKFLLYNDIGLVKLNKKVKLSSYVRPACLPTMFEPVENQFIESSWTGGRCDSKRNHLRKIKLAKISHAECSESYKIFMSRKLPDGIRNETQICAGLKSKRSEFSQGGSGSALQAYHKDIYCMYTLIGVGSFGTGCWSDIPDVFSRIFPYLDWIKKTVWGNKS